VLQTARTERTERGYMYRYVQIALLLLVCIVLNGCALLAAAGAISAVQAVRAEMQKQQEKNKVTPRQGIEKEKIPPSGEKDNNPHQNRKGCIRLPTGWHCEQTLD